MMQDLYGREMFLSTQAERAARVYVDLGGRITCGHRDLWRQACAMAQNILAVKPGFPYGDRLWVQKVYLHGGPVQDWIDQNDDAVSYTDLSNGIYGVLKTMQDTLPADQQISHHLALPCPVFDCEPILDAQQSAVMQAKIRTLPGLTIFLPREGGLIRWHVEFADLPTVKVAVPASLAPMATRGSDDV